MNEMNEAEKDKVEQVEVRWDTDKLRSNLRVEDLLAAQRAESEYLERRARTQAYQQLKRIEHELWAKLMDFENAYGFRVRGIHITRTEANPFFEWRKELVQPLPQDQITGLDITLETPKVGTGIETASEASAF